MSYDVICFDCDSTLSRIEGIDELAKVAGVGEAMAKLTNAAMNGEVPLEAVYGQRLDIIQPNRQSIDWLANLYVKEMVTGVQDVFGRLLACGKEVHIISGGLRPAILPLAEMLGIPVQQVHAVDIYFHENGGYRDYDRRSPLARSGGKAEICQQLLGNRASLALVGDGKTDMEAKQPGVTVIGFGGVADRAITRELADFYCAEASLAVVLDWLLCTA